MASQPLAALQVLLNSPVQAATTSAYESLTDYQDLIDNPPLSLLTTYSILCGAFAVLLPRGSRG